MNKVYHYIGFVVFWAFILFCIGVAVYVLILVIYLVKRTKRYQNISSWVWFYILRKNLPTENIRFAYKTYGYWKYAAKYRLRNIKKASKPQQYGSKFL